VKRAASAATGAPYGVKATCSLATTEAGFARAADHGAPTARIGSGGRRSPAGDGKCRGIHHGKGDESTLNFALAHETVPDQLFRQIPRRQLRR